MKGWSSGWGNDFAESSVGFQYIAWKDFEPNNVTPGNGLTYNFTKVEEIIARNGSKGRHLTLRLYCDWDGGTGDDNCPAWLYSESKVRKLIGDNGRFVTDYNDPTFIKEAVQAIQALAAHYDSDPRIYMFQLGILGYWGEWHTSGSSFGGNSYNIADVTKTQILDAYKVNFKNKKIVGRYPWSEPLKSAGWIGFHNDYFVANNGHSDEFDRAVDAGKYWLQGPIGGEVPPRSDSEAMTERQALFNTAKGLNMIETGHYSSMQPGNYRRVSGQDYYDNYMKFHKRMGYNFQINDAQFFDTLSRTSELSVTVLGSNTGIAPFYYDWDIEFALLDQSGTPVTLKKSQQKITGIQPLAAYQFSASLPLTSVPANTYRLGIRLVQPGAASAKSDKWSLDARNTYILFANDMTVVDGKWNEQTKALEGGWSILGNVKVQ